MAGIYRQRQFTDRLRDVDVLKFESSTPLKETKPDPGGELALVVPPPSLTEKELMKRVGQMDWTGVGKLALDLFQKAQEIKSSDFGVKMKHIVHEKLRFLPNNRHAEFLKMHR